MGHSVKITTPIPSAKKVAKRLGLDSQHVAELLEIVRRHSEPHSIVTEKKRATKKKSYAAIAGNGKPAQVSNASR